MVVDGGSDSEAGLGVRPNEQKIRDSCNACSSHKIRCTKERPACRRCASKGLQCEYSVSRRNGKRSRSDSLNGAPASTPGIMPSAFALDHFSPLCDMNFGLPANSSDIADVSWMMEGIAADIENTNTSMPAASLRDVIEPAYLHRHLTGDFVSSFGPTQDSGGDTASSRTTYRPPRFAEQNSRATTVSALHGRGDDCTARALGIVMRMHIAPKTCSAPGPISRQRGAQNSRSEARDIDTVLQTNREAISTLNSILDCSACSSDHMCMLTCHLAVQKTVDWYAAILGTDSGGHGADLAELVSAGPIFMGSFALGREAQRLVHASVVVTEVRDHLQPLVGRLSRGSSSALGSGLPSPPSTSPPTSLGGELVESHACKLQDQIASMLASASPLQ